MNQQQKCSRTKCKAIAQKICSTCRKVAYCSYECQKIDWKTCHKKVCELTEEILPIDEVARIIKQSLDQANIGSKMKAKERVDRDVLVLEKMLVFAKRQFGPSVEGESYRIRENGDVIDSWRVATLPLCLILMQLTDLFINQQSPGMYDKALSHALEARQLIRPRRENIESGELDYELTLFFQIEINLAEIYGGIYQLDNAEYHCLESLNYARRCRSAENTAIVFESLKRYATLRR